MKKLLLIAALFGVAACTNTDDTAALKGQIAELQAKVDAFEAEKALEAKNIALYDKMDLVAFTAHDMDTIKGIHGDDVVVYNPDGSVTRGMTPKTRAPMAVRYLPERRDQRAPYQVRFRRLDRRDERHHGNLLSAHEPARWLRHTANWQAVSHSHRDAGAVGRWPDRGGISLLG